MTRGRFCRAALCALAMLASFAGCSAPARGVVVNTSPAPGAAREGVLIAYAGGREIGRERFRDDGAALVSEVALAGHRFTVTVTRTPRHARVAVGENTVEREVPADVAVLENGSWQAYGLVAEWFAAAVDATPIRVLIPGQGALVPATVSVHSASDGGHRVSVAIGALTVLADVRADGSVSHVAIPAQSIEVWPEGHVVAPPVARAAPDGVVEEPVEVTSAGVVLRGSLWLPAGAPAHVPVVLMVAGSGPTDRDCNQPPLLSTDAFRMLAHGLAQHGIASLRFDKRGVGASGRNFAIEQTTITDFVDDVAAILARLRSDARFSTVTLAGHSEGGLIALLVAQHHAVDAVALLASPGRPLGVVVREQLARQSDAATMVEVDRLLAAARAGQPMDPVPPALRPLFNRGIAAFLHSVLDLDPSALFHSLRGRASIIQGETDAQISVADARALAAARPDATLVLLPNTNHVLKTEAAITLPQASYTDASRPLAAGVLDALVAAVAR